jgi:hypothetical protein
MQEDFEKDDGGGAAPGPGFGRSASDVSDNGDAVGGESGHSSIPVRNRPRRKSTEKPAGQDALRQSFSKRKKGMAAKAYQLSRLTNAKVAIFVVNEKGSSWAYATPGFGAAVSQPYLALMRSLAGVPNLPKLATEVMPHAANHHPLDDREDWRTQLHPALIGNPHQFAGVQPLYKVQPGPSVIAMLPPPAGVNAAGQAVGHPTGHVSIVNHPVLQPVAEDPPAADSASGMCVARAVPDTLSSGPPEAAVSGKQGTKRAAESVSARNGTKKKKAKVGGAELEKSRVELKPQAAILPV